MAKKKKQSTLLITRVTRTIYFFIAIFALSIVIFDSGNLLTGDAVVDRWTLLSVLFVSNTVAWLIAAQSKSPSIQAILIYLLSGGLLCFAGFMTYWERGMASSSTILYILPILTIATLKNRHALLATAGLAAGTYAFAAVKYFNDFFNEGYRIQLWGNIALYSGVILTSAWLIMILANLRHDSK